MEPQEMKRNSAQTHTRKAAKGSRHMQSQQNSGSEQWNTPAYQILAKHGLLDNSYRLESSEEIDAVPANASRSVNLALDICCCPMKCFFKTFEVSAGKLQLVSDGRGVFDFYGQGVHRICDPFYSLGKAVAYSQGVIRHGDLTVAVVEQGQIGFAVYQGQPVLLPPGLHQWRSPTMFFQQNFDLNNNVIRMGPLTLVTVDSGYSAVTEDNGEQKILPGGSTYLLTHRNCGPPRYMRDMRDARGTCDTRVREKRDTRDTRDIRDIWDTRGTRDLQGNSRSTFRRRSRARRSSASRRPPLTTC